MFILFLFVIILSNSNHLCAVTHTQWKVANGRMLLFQRRSNTFEFVDVTLEMSQGGGTLTIQHGASGDVTRVPLFGQCASLEPKWVCNNKFNQF
jgi:hypothetical protein